MYANVNLMKKMYQWWNKDKWWNNRYECKKGPVCEKGYIWNPAICSCENGKYLENIHCVKGLRIRNYSGPYFPVFGLKLERYGVSRHIQSECGKMWTGIILNTDTFYAVAMDDSAVTCDEVIE